MFDLFDIVERTQNSFDIVAENGNIVERCFDNVAVFGVLTFDNVAENSNNVEATFDNVAKNGNIVEATSNIVACYNVASTLLPVWTGLNFSML